MNKEQMTIKALFDTSKTQAGRRLSKYTYPWEVLPHIGEIAEAIGKRLPQDEYNHLGKNIWIHKSVNVPPTVALRGPAVIGPKTEIRNGAFIRGNVIAGEGVVIGNSVELKNVILFDGVQVAERAYDSLSKLIDNELYSLSFDDLVYLQDEEGFIEKVNMVNSQSEESKEIDNEPEYEM